MAKGTGTEIAIAGLQKAVEQNREMTSLAFTKVFDKLDKQTSDLTTIALAAQKTADALANHLADDIDFYRRVNELDNAKDGRVTVLEKDKIKIMGAAAGIAALFTGGINGIMKIVQGGGN